MLAQGERPSRTPRDLVADVEAFTTALRWGEFADDAWSDEPEWVDHIEALLSRATQAFIAGDRAVAAESYGRLLRVFQLDGEVEAFCGEEPAEFRVRSDLGEALANHLRALYETTPVDQRAAKLLDEIETLHRLVGGRVGLQAILNSDAAPLVDLDWFLPQWLDAVGRLEGERDDRRKALRGFLLREATLLSAGADGLGELARREGSDEPQIYHEWLDALLSASRRDDAVAAAREAVGAVQESWAKARLADRLATLAVERGDETLALEAGRTAWRSHPSLRRLRWLCGVGSPDSGMLRARLATEREVAEQGAVRVGGRLAAVLDLLLGDVVAAVNRLSRAPSLGWSSCGHPGPIVFPYALLAAARLSQPPLGSALEELWDGMNEDFDLDFDCSEGEETDELVPEEPTAAARGPAEAPRLSDLLSDSLNRLDLAPQDRRRLVDTTRRVVERRAEAVVSSKHRRAYARVALLAAAWTDGALLAGSGHGDGLSDALLLRYPRHPAFKREISSAARRRVSTRRGHPDGP